MARFQIYKNLGSRSAIAPFLVDVQNDFLDVLGTRIVVPLLAANALKRRPTGDLYPLIKVNGKDYVLSAPELAAISLTSLKTAVGSVSEGERGLIQEALDRVFGSY
jgi:toxin CcdB